MICPVCNRPVSDEGKNVVCATSLGNHYYHYNCAVKAWAKLAANEKEQREGSRSRRSEAMRKRWAEGKMR